MAPFDVDKIPSRQEVAEFTGGSGQCCTVDNFRPDLEGTPKSTWNKSVAMVFAKAFVQRSDVPAGVSRVTVARAFATHLKGLQTSYRNWKAAGSPINADRLRKRRRYMRKSYTHTRRLTVVAEHPRLQRHVWFIQALGVGGMSSDESEREGVKPKYRRARLEWRNPLLDDWLDTIDIFVRAKHFKEDGSSTAGAHVHNRADTPRAVSSRPAVPGLPRAAYNPQWLETLSDYQLELLGPIDTAYSFKHEAEIVQYVSFRCFPIPLSEFASREALQLLKRGAPSNGLAA
ncbi:hypothetical protein C8Q76DRAFT_609568 [Earliella scabrosa]|nr:hypothetical protein C8Q76DRAFT_609568 [Earliella scabrosa]